MEKYYQTIESIQNNQLNSSFPLWLWWFLLFTVIIALIICVVVIIIVLSKTKRKINEFNNNEIKLNYGKTTNPKQIKEDDSDKPITVKQQNQKYKIIFQKMIKDLNIQSKNLNILNVELTSISKKHLKIITYLKKNRIKTIGDLVNIKLSTIDKFIIDFDKINPNNSIKEKNNFIAFLNQVKKFIKKRG